jgi:hypothetical protein
VVAEEVVAAVAEAAAVAEEAEVAEEAAAVVAADVPRHFAAQRSLPARASTSPKRGA